MRLHLLVVFAALAFLSGCASFPYTSGPPGKDAKCCASASAIPFQPLSADQATTLYFEDGSPVLEIQGKLTFARGLALPVGKRIRIEVESVLSTQYLPTATAFAPAVTFLDAQKSQVGPPIAVRLREAVRFVDGGYLSGSIKVPEAARYVVFFSSQALSSDAGRSGSVMQAANGQYHVVPPSEPGTLKVALVTEPPS